MVKVADRVKVSTATTGTGTITLGSAVSGFVVVPSSLNNQTLRYVIEEGNDFEIGTGTYTHSGTTLSRTLTVSSTGSLLNLSGSATVFLSLAAVDIQELLDFSNLFSLPSSDGTSGQALTTDGSGSLTFSTISGGGGSSPSALTETTFSATANQTAFVVSNGITYAANVSVFRNGVKLEEGSSKDYTVNASTNTVTLTSGATLNDVVEVLEYGQPQSSGTGVTVHANQAAMLTDAVSAAEGTLHYDTNSNILYVKKRSAGSSGFFLLASITNVSPQINTFSEATGGAAANNLSTAGTFGLTASQNSVITINATDDNLDTLTYSATVTSGTATDVISSPSFPVTNQSSNVFTLTPATSGGGSVTIRFDVSDSSSVDSVTQTFSISFKIADSRFTRLLMATDNAAGGNQSITDSSSTGHTITVSGDAHAGSFSPYRAGGYSVYFDGNDLITVADSSDFTFGTDDFTCEFWLYDTDTANATRGYVTTSQGNDFQGFFIGTYQGNYYTVINAGGSGWDIVINTGTVPKNQWVHICLQRSGSTFTLYGNGSVVATDNNSGALSNSNNLIAIGGRSNSSQYAQAYISDVRVVKGTAVYSGAFTPPIGRLTTTGGEYSSATNVNTSITSNHTKLLACHLPYLRDGSINNKTITLVGDPAIEPLAPYDNVLEYSEATHGGSISFDGSDHLSIADSTDFTVGSNSFTAECWVYPTTSASQPVIFGQWSNPYSWAIQFSYNSNRNLRLIFHTGSFSDNNSSAVIALNQWSHVALVKSGTSVKGYINGSEVLTATVGTLTDSSSAITVGGQTGGGSPFTGNIAEARLVIGTAVYSGEFTPPSGPLTTTGGTYPSSTNVNTSITSSQTKLLLKNTDAHVLDKAQVSNLKLAGGAAASTTQAKFGSTASVYFDGSGDFAKIDTSGELQKLGQTGTAATIEAWVYLNSNPSSNGTAVYSQGTEGSTGGNNVLSFEIQNNRTLRAVVSGAYDVTAGNTAAVSTGAVPLTTWTHIALVLHNQTWTLYINGSADGTSTGNYPSGTNHSTAYIGRVYYGSDRTADMYIQDLRVSNKARYTGASYTVPTSSLKG